MSVYIGVEAINVYGEEVCLQWDSHGFQEVQKMICILDVAGVLGGEGAQEMVNILGDVIGGAVAV